MLKPFCVDIKAEGLTDLHIHKLVELCCDVGANPYVGVQRFGGNKYTYMFTASGWGYFGVSRVMDTDSTRKSTEIFDNNIMKYNDAISMLQNLIPQVHVRSTSSELQRTFDQLRNHATTTEVDLVIQSPPEVHNVRVEMKISKPHKDWCAWKMNPDLGNEDTYCDCPAGW